MNWNVIWTTAYKKNNEYKKRKISNVHEALITWVMSETGTGGLAVRRKLGHLFELVTIGYAMRWREKWKHTFRSGAPQKQLSKIYNNDANIPWAAHRGCVFQVADHSAKHPRPNNPGNFSLSLFFFFLFFFFFSPSLTLFLQPPDAFLQSEKLSPLKNRRRVYARNWIRTGST